MSGCFGNHPVDRYLERQLIQHLKDEESVKCSYCENQSEWDCEKCGSPICQNHQATYNQFTQIDYNCCKNCADED